MSVKTVKAFFEKVEGDKALQAKLKTLGKKPNETMEAAVAELVKIAKTEGFEFTSQDFAEARSEQPAIPSGSSVHVTKADSWKCEAGTEWAKKPGCYLLAGCGSDHPLWTNPHPKPCDPELANW